MTELPFPPGAPPFPGLSLRGFAGESDFPSMCAVANACFAADQVELRRTPEDMARDYASFVNSDPAQDVCIAELHGELAGYVRGSHWVQGDGVAVHGHLGFVAPPWRRRGIGTILLAWMEERHRRLAAERKHGPDAVFQCSVTQPEYARIALLQIAGYQPVRHFFTMVRPDLEDVADFQLPAGVELRPVRPEHYRAIWDAHMDAFSNHWGWAPPQEADYRQWLSNPIVFQPHLWQVAWDIATGEVAGQVRGFINEKYNRDFKQRRGWTEFISVAAPWRRRGLARSLISRSLRAQRELGMADSGLGVDSDNVSGANRVYEDCGFRVVKRATAFRKPMAQALAAS